MIAGAVQLHDLRPRSVEVAIIVECFEPAKDSLLAAADQPPQLVRRDESQSRYRADDIEIARRDLNGIRFLLTNIALTAEP